MFTYSDEYKVIETPLGTITWDRQRIKGISKPNPTLIEAIRFYETIEDRLPQGWTGDPDIILSTSEDGQNLHIIITGDAD